MEQASKLSTDEKEVKKLEFAINQFQKAADCCSQATADCAPVERSAMELQKELESGRVSDHETLDPVCENLKSDAVALQVKIGEFLGACTDDSAGRRSLERSSW